MRVLVTGATGFLGGVLVRRLLEKNLEPVALVRATSRTDGLAALGVSHRSADLLSGEGVDAALDGVDAVIHAAGGGHALDVAAIHANNTGTTKTLLEAVRRSAPNLRRFVFVSSLAAHGPTASAVPPEGPEGSAPITHYGRSKWAAEKLLSAVDDVPVTIARPPSIYGPGDWRMRPLYRLASRGWVPLPGPSRSASMIHVDDCASALVAMTTSTQGSGRVYFVEDGVARDTAEMARTIGQAVGRRVRILRVPAPLLRVAGAAAEGWGRLRGVPVLFHRDKVRELVQPHWTCSSRLLREELGWAPAVDFDDGVRQTAEDYRRRGWL